MKAVSDQLTIDGARYKTHPDCKALVCFVYDPDDLVRNPRRWSLYSEFAGDYDDCFLIILSKSLAGEF